MLLDGGYGGPCAASEQEMIAAHDLDPYAAAALAAKPRRKAERELDAPGAATHDVYRRAFADCAEQLLHDLVRPRQEARDRARR